MLRVPAFVLLAVSCAICLELLGIASSFTIPELYSSLPAVQAKLYGIDESEFLRVRLLHSPTTGWDHQPSSTNSFYDCNGGKHFATYTASTARQFRGYSDESAQVIMIGDSYTHGDEVDDEDTIAAQMFQQSGIVAANLGVGGFSPVQAVLKAEQDRELFPNARIVVLGIMYEDIRRVVNGYDAAFSSNDLEVFSFRPFVNRGEVSLIPGTLFDSKDALERYAALSMRTDFWAKPEAQFPYSVSLVRAVLTDNFFIRMPGNILKLFRRQYWADYHNTKLSDALFTIVDKYFNWARANDLQPVVIFVPQNQLDTQSAYKWIETYGKLLAGGTILNAELPDTDWRRYNQKADGSCHPSVYGYGKIAEFYAAVITKLKNAGRIAN